MKKIETTSWIFMAIAMASQKEPANFNEISMIADGINHTIPSHKEMQTSIVWLSNKGFITKQNKKYSLTPIGKNSFETASRKTKGLLNIWKNLEIELQTYS